MNSRTEHLATLSGVTLLHVAALAGLTLLATQRVPITPPQLARMELVTLPTPHPIAPAPAAPAKPRPKPTVKPKQTPPRTPTPKTPLAPRPQAVRPVAAAPAAITAPSTEERRSEAATPTASPAPTAKVVEPAEPQVTPPLYRGGYLDNPKPRYPALSLELNESGTVRVRVQVSAEGRPLDVSLAQSSGYPRLDRAALEAVRQWRFVPARRGQEAIPFNFIVPVDFSIKSH